MKARNNLYNKLITILSFCLLSFHTLTYLQSYYSYIVTLAIFAIIVFLAILSNKGTIRVYEYSSLVFLSVMVLVIVFIGCSVKNRALTSMLGAYLPYIIWPIIYLIVDPIMDKHNKKSFLLLFLVVYVIGVVATLSVVSTDNNAARLLAGAASDTTRTYYYKQGVGGYGFIYGCVFLLYGLILWMRKEENIVYKILLLAICVITLLMIVYASYTTAMLLSLILIFLSIYTYSRKKYATFLFVIAILCVIFLIKPILQMLYDMALNLELEWIVKRIGQLLDAENSGNYGELRRSQLYMLSLNTFWENMFLGGSSIGGHSMFLDHMGMYGIFGAIFGISYFAWLNTLRRTSKRRIGLVYYLFAALLCINTMDTIVLLPMVQFALPLMLSMVDADT